MSLARCYAEPKCETCGEAIEGEAGFSNDDHDFCDGVGPDGMTCADGARAVLAEDLAREAAHQRGERCIETDDAGLVAELTSMVRANQAAGGYALAKRERERYRLARIAEEKERRERAQRGLR